jgi:hypothetical protein
LNYFKQIYLTKQQDVPQQTLTFNLTPKSAVLIPKAKSEYTGKGTPKTATFNAKIHIVDASSTSDVNLLITNSSTNPVTVVVDNNSTTISGNSDTKIIIGKSDNGGKFIKNNIPIEFRYTDSISVTIRACYTKKQEKEKCIPTNGIKIELK